MSHNDIVSQELFGRDQDFERAWSLLLQRSFLLTGPRRVGKTELLKHMARQPADGWEGVRVDVQGLTTVEPAAVRLERALAQIGLAGGVAKKSAKQVRKASVLGVGVELAEPEGRSAWERMGDHVAAAVKRLPDEKRLFIALDEAPWWLDGIRRERGAAAARAALAQLRHLRQRGDLCARTRWILTGSVGIASLARELEASAEVGDLQPAYALQPLDASAGAALFETELLESAPKVRPGAGELAWREAGGIPHWIKILAGRCAHPRVPTVGPETVQRVIEELLELRALFDDEGRSHLVRRHDDDREPMLVAILGAAATGGDETPETALLATALAASAGGTRRAAQEALAALVDEHYLVRGAPAGTWRFAVPLLRRWWQKYRVGARS